MKPTLSLSHRRGGQTTRVRSASNSTPGLATIDVVSTEGKGESAWLFPVVAIVGRPNVGKSSLFNWLAGRRIAIVDPTAGVTRDRLSTLLRAIDGRVFELTDTGGMGIQDVDDLTADVQRQIDQAIAQAVRDSLPGRWPIRSRCRSMSWWPSGCMLPGQAGRRRGQQVRHAATGRPDRRISQARPRRADPRQRAAKPRPRSPLRSSARSVAAC